MDDQEIKQAALEDDLDLDSYGDGDTIRIDKGSLMRILREVYRVGHRDGVNTGY